MKNLPWPRLNEDRSVWIPPTGIPGIRLKITQKHIDEGIRRSSAKCMEALALRDLGFSSTEVSSDTVRGNRDDIRYIWLHPSRGPIKLKLWDEELEEMKRCKKLGIPFKSKIKPYSLMLRGNSASCSPVQKRGPFKVPRAKHPTRGKKLKRRSWYSPRRYHGTKSIQNPEAA